MTLKTCFRDDKRKVYIFSLNAMERSENFKRIIAADFIAHHPKKNVIISPSQRSENSSFQQIMLKYRTNLFFLAFYWTSTTSYFIHLSQQEKTFHCVGRKIYFLCISVKEKYILWVIHAYTFEFRKYYSGETKYDEETWDERYFELAVADWNNVNWIFMLRKVISWWD